MSSDYHSSSAEFAPEALRARVQQTAQKLAALPEVEPLPPLPRADRIRLFVQSPYRLFLYWSLARDPSTTLHRIFGDRATLYTLSVRLIDLIGGQQYLRPASPDGNEWFDVFPGRAYRVELGLFASGRPFIRLLVSNEVRTPRVGVSPQVDQSLDFQAPPEALAQMLADAGQTLDALEAALEAALPLASELPADILSALSPDKARLLAALVAGLSLDELRRMFAPELIAWLSGFDHETLRAALRAALSFAPEKIPFRLHGASEMVMPRGPFARFMPSLAAGRLPE